MSFWIINAEQPLDDWLGPHWFFVWLWQGENSIWRVRLQAMGTEMVRTHPHSTPKCPHVWDNFCLKFFSHVLLTLLSCLQKHQALFLPMAPSDSFRSPSLPDHVCPGSGGCLYPYSWDSPVRKHFWRMSLATDVVQASTTCPALTTQWSKGLKEIPTRSGIKELGHQQNHQKMISTGLAIFCLHAGVYAFKGVWRDSVTLDLAQTIWEREIYW